MKKYCEECSKQFTTNSPLKVVCDDCVRDDESFDDTSYSDTTKLEDQFETSLTED